LNCFHEWDSLNKGGVLRCSNCHRNQGIDHEKILRAVEAAKAALRAVIESPPPHRPPQSTCPIQLLQGDIAASYYGIEERIITRSENNLLALFIEEHVSKIRDAPSNQLV